MSRKEGFFFERKNQRTFSLECPRGGGAHAHDKSRFAAFSAEKVESFLLPSRSPRPLKRRHSLSKD
jgi:hypothetical protein